MLRSIKELRGYKVLAEDGEVGKVHEFFFEDEHWGVRYLIVNAGSWLEDKKVLLSPVSITRADWAAKYIRVVLTRKQIMNSPEIDADKPVSRQQEIKLHKYYQWPYYWTEAAFPGLGSTAVPPPQYMPPSDEEIEGENGEDGDPHLRSTREVIDYHIEAPDGEIGHVEDFVLDDESWILRYMVVDTRNWLPGGKKVLISPQWIQEINWADAKVYVLLMQEQIKDSPEFDASEPINREYEERLHDFYGRPRYWT